MVQPLLFSKQSTTLAILTWPIARHPRTGARRVTDRPREERTESRTFWMPVCVRGHTLASWGVPMPTTNTSSLTDNAKALQKCV